MSPHETSPAVSPAEELGAHPTTNLGATGRVRSLDCATVVSSVQETQENVSPKSDVRSVFSSISQKSLRSGISVSVLKKMAKIGSTRAAPEDFDAELVQSRGQTATNSSEKPRFPALVQISPKILGGIICEHLFDSRNKGSPKSEDVGYIRMLKPKTKHLVKSRPLLDTPIRVDSEEQGVEVVQKNKFIVWEKETTLEVVLPSARCEARNGYELVVEVGVIHNDETCALGTAIISLREGELDKMRFLVCPKPLKRPSRKSKSFRHQEEPNVKYRLDSSAAFAVEVEVTPENVSRSSDAPKHRKDSPLNAKVILSDLAARFGANTPKPSVYAAGVVEEIREIRSSPRGENSCARVGFDDRAAPLQSSNDTGKDAPARSDAEHTETDESSSEEERSRLPYVEMTSFSLESNYTDDVAGVESRNCLLFVGSIGTDEHSSSSDNESSSGSSSTTGDCSAFSDASSFAHLSVANKELVAIMKKRQAISPKKKKKATRTSLIPSLGFLKEGPSSPTTRTRKKSLKNQLRRVLEFNNRGAVRLSSRRNDDRSDPERAEINSIMDSEIGSASSVKGFHSASRDFVAQTCCSPFQNGGPISACSNFLGTIPERDGIQLSHNKVTQLAKALQMSPSTLVEKIEQLDE